MSSEPSSLKTKLRSRESPETTPLELSRTFIMKTRTRTNIRHITYAAIIAALYTALTLFAAAMGLSSGVIQVRLSEALTVLPAITPAAIPGLTIGCLISNLITGCIPVDIVFGTVATLIGAIGTRLICKLHPALSPLPPIIANTLIVPFVLKFGYGIDGGIPYFMATVGAGEVISCGALGLILLYTLKKQQLFKGDLL